MTDTGRLNLQWSHELIRGFVASGVRHAVISPGARSTPLTLAALRQDGLRCHVAVDERSAAFFALGLAKASQVPALLIATSGSAPAHWLPAIIEASQAGVPLIALSADRPPELHACGANQSIEQRMLFGAHVRQFFDPGAPFASFEAGWLHRLALQAFDIACWPHPGPVHINLPFREPLFDDSPLPVPAAAPSCRVEHPRLSPAPSAVAALAQVLSSGPGVIVCGECPASPGLPEAIVALAERLRCPIIAEALSGLRFGPHDRQYTCVNYANWLDDADFVQRHRPAWVLRFGTWPTSRKLQAWLAQIPTQLLIDPWPRRNDPQHRVHQLLHADLVDTCHALLDQSLTPQPTHWREAFRLRDGAARADVPWHIAALLAQLPDDTALFIGNSLAIRQFDAASGCNDRRIRCYGNRGASGIDGNIATTIGLAEIHGRAVALIGDLTCQHDLGSLALATGRDVVIVTVNNGGGGIFDLLPQSTLPEFQVGWRTPQQVRFDHAAATFGLNYRPAKDEETLREAFLLALKTGGPWLIEVFVPGSA